MTDEKLSLPRLAFKAMQKVCKALGNEKVECSKLFQEIIMQKVIIIDDEIKTIQVFTSKGFLYTKKSIPSLIIAVLINIPALFVEIGSKKSITRYLSGIMVTVATIMSECAHFFLHDVNNVTCIVPLIWLWERGHTVQICQLGGYSCRLGL